MGKCQIAFSDRFQGLKDDHIQGLIWCVGKIIMVASKNEFEETLKKHNGFAEEVQASAEDALLATAQYSDGATATLEGQERALEVLAALPTGAIAKQEQTPQVKAALLFQSCFRRRMEKRVREYIVLARHAFRANGVNFEKVMQLCLLAHRKMDFNHSGSMDNKGELMGATTYLFRALGMEANEVKFTEQWIDFAVSNTHDLHSRPMRPYHFVAWFFAKFMTDPGLKVRLALPRKFFYSDALATMDEAGADPSGGLPGKGTEDSSPHTALIENLFPRYDLDGSGTLNTNEEMHQLTMNMHFKLSNDKRPDDAKVKYMSDEILGKLAAIGELNDENAWTLQQFNAWFHQEFPGA